MIKPLYMWAGGKTKMIPKYKESPGIPYTGYDTYVEPFFGGGAMLLHVSAANPNLSFVINDINDDIMYIYRSIKSNVQDFIKYTDTLSEPYLKLDHAERKKYFYTVRNDYITKYESWDKVYESSVLYFLMKTAFNGIYQATKESKGRFATPAGLLNQKTSVYDEQNVMEWHDLLQKVEIYSGDWKTVPYTENSFLFMDPPYRDSFTSYDQSFSDSDHKSLINFCKDMDKQGNQVFYCNRFCDDTFYLDNKGTLEIEYYDVTYTAGRRKNVKDGFEAKKAKEILLYSSRLKQNTLF